MKNTITLALQMLVFGDRNTFIFEYKPYDEPLVSTKNVTKLLLKLAKQGYGISNPQILFGFTKSNLKEFKEQFINLIDDNSKDGFILRKTFAESEELTDYTEGEWQAILAQYAITYGWGDRYNAEFNQDAEKVLSDYVDSLDLDTKNLITNTAEKVFSVGDAITLGEIIKNILESKTVLRAQQLKTLEETPKYILVEASKRANITIKETLVKVMKMLSTEKLDFALLKTATDVLRFIVSAYAKKPIEGQINKTLLKETRIRIPTSVRKMLLNNLELIAEKKAVVKRKTNISSATIQSKIAGSKYLCEDMFSYEDFWKIIAKYLRFENSKKMRAKYPLYTNAIDLLYDGDRSWTFNGRYSSAKESLDYAKAISVAKERPGFLLRNIIEFVRMTRGTKLPTKKGTKVPMENAFQNALTGKSTDLTSRIIKTDGIDYLVSEDFEKLLDKSANTKLAWQLIEQLKNKELFKDIYKRNVQGVDIEYSTPIPAVDKKIAKKVRKVILKSIKNKLRDRNSDVGKVFIDKDSYGYKLQYSGRDSTEISYAGEFLSPGTELNLLDLMKNKDIKMPLLRLGVMWKGKKSTDLDHSLTLGNGQVVYYGKPVMRSPSGKMLIVSSGDVTSCSMTKDGKFSTELLDIDLLSCKEANVKSMFSSFISFSGATTIGELECYVFFSIIDKSERVIEGNRVWLDLAKQDYAVRIDPDNIDKTGSYIGCSVDLVNNVIKVLSIPVKNDGGHFSNARSNNVSFQEAIKNAKVDGLTIGYALNKVFDKTQFTDCVDEADIIVSRKDYASVQGGAVILHPGRNAEQINNMLF